MFFLTWSPAPQHTGASVKPGLPKTDPQFRASNLQGAGGHADDFGDSLSAFSPLYKVGDLPHSFWCKLCWSSAPLRKGLYRLMGIHGPRAQSIRKGQTPAWRPFFVA
jgi:hypothetical protein